MIYLIDNHIIIWLKGENMIGLAIISVLVIIIILEISRSFRLLNKLVDDIEELKIRVADIEKLHKK